jgi:hypothetical protein
MQAGATYTTALLHFLTRSISCSKQKTFAISSFHNKQSIKQQHRAGQFESISCILLLKIRTHA